MNIALLDTNTKVMFLLILAFVSGCFTGHQTVQPTMINKPFEQVTPVHTAALISHDTTVIVQKTVVAPDPNLLKAVKHNAVLQTKSAIKDSVNYDLSQTVVKLSSAVSILQDRLAQTRQGADSQRYADREQHLQDKAIIAALRDTAAALKSKNIVKFNVTNTNNGIVHWFPPIVGSMLILLGFMLGRGSKDVENKKSSLFGIQVKEIA